MLPHLLYIYHTKKVGEVSSRILISFGSLCFFKIHKHFHSSFIENAYGMLQFSLLCASTGGAIYSPNKKRHEEIGFSHLQGESFSLIINAEF